MAPKDKKAKIDLKVPKGTKDWEGKDMVIRDKIFSNITSVFKRHGGVTIDTPVFELREVLTGKYGEDSKLIYDLADQGGEICSLRYDLTVPFARWLAMNPQVQNIKRYHIAKVYRRDQPAMSKGRMREFYQCDFDIAGSYDSMLPDAEVLRIAMEILDSLNIGKYTIKINHRKILDGLFEVCGVPTEKIRQISSAVDKLDKLPWEDVRKEMTEEKGLAPEVADTIGQYVQKKGGRDLLTELKEIPELTANPSFSDGLSEMELLIDYLEIFKVMPVLSFDLSLARGLDYYTGVIYEVVTEASAPPAKAAGASVAKNKRGPKPPKDDDPDADRSNDDSIGVGSIAAGASVDKNKRGPKPPKDDDPDADRSNDDSIGVGSIAAGASVDKNKRGPNPPKDDDPDADRSNDDSIGVGSIAAGASVDKNKRGPKPPKDDDPDADRSNDDSIGVGSIAAGGRYDELVGMFANSSKGRIPCVGISFGVDRIFSITKARMMEEVRGNEVDIYVMAFGGKGFNGLVKERMSVCKTLWDANIKAEFFYKVKPKLPQQFAGAEKNGVPYAVVLGEDELVAGMVKIKEMGLPEGHPEKNGVDVKLDELVQEVKKRLIARGLKEEELVRAVQAVQLGERKKVAFE